MQSHSVPERRKTTIGVPASITFLPPRVPRVIAVGGSHCRVTFFDLADNSAGRAVVEMIGACCESCCCVCVQQAVVGWGAGLLALLPRVLQTPWQPHQTTQAFVSAMSPET
eukprot:SAG31_NODE_1058_length_10121_cov_14.446617_2_plen_111_part_00